MHIFPIWKGYITVKILEWSCFLWFSFLMKILTSFWAWEAIMVDAVIFLIYGLTWCIGVRPVQHHHQWPTTATTIGTTNDNIISKNSTRRTTVCFVKLSHCHVALYCVVFHGSVLHWYRRNDLQKLCILNSVLSSLNWITLCKCSRLWQDWFTWNSEFWTSGLGYVLDSYR